MRSWRVPTLQPITLLVMPSVSLQSEDTKARFGVSKPIENLPSNLTKEEEGYVKVVLEYMEVGSDRSLLPGASSQSDLLTSILPPDRLLAREQHRRILRQAPVCSQRHVLRAQHVSNRTHW